MMNDRVERAVAYVTHKTGLALSTTQVDELRHYLTRRMAAHDPGESLAWLDDPREFRLIVDCLTVRETFFFRFDDQFNAFRTRLLPRMLAAARAEGRPVRVWSAGCCTGEEPYTLALIALELGANDVEILGTDINENYLESAMTGAFSKRSIQLVPEAVLRRYFDAAHDRFVLKEEVRRRVTFKWLNLADTAYPSFLNGTAGLDMIWCRNVLIYVDKGRLRAIIDRFANCLLPTGVLALGHSETLPRDWSLQVVPVGEAFFYGHRRPAPPPADVAAPPARTVTAPVQPVTPPPAPPVADDPAALVEQAASLADRGRMTEAVRACESAVARDPSLVRGHYLLGLLTRERVSEAHAHFRRAVYLDPHHLPARLHLARAAENLGRHEEAVREYRNLERLASTRPPDEVLDVREGITVGMLSLMGRTALRRHGIPTGP